MTTIDKNWTAEMMVAETDSVILDGSAHGIEHHLVVDDLKRLRPRRLSITFPMYCPHAVLALMTSRLRSLKINEAYYSAAEWNDVLGRVPAEIEELRLVYSRTIDLPPLLALVKRAENLRVLDLHQSRIPWDAPEEMVRDFFQAIGNLTELTHLDLQNVAYNSGLIKVRNDSLRRLTKLQFLDMQRCHTYPPHPDELATLEVFHGLPNLKTIKCFLSVEEQYTSRRNPPSARTGKGFDVEGGRALHV